MDANTLLAGAIAGGEDGLSPRDCWLCLAYLYANGASAQMQLNAAISADLDKLADGDILKCLASALNGLSTQIERIVMAGAGTSDANGFYNLVGSIYVNSNNPNATITLSGGNWFIQDLTQDFNYYLSPSLLSGWTTAADGEFPPPAATQF